MKRIEAEGDHLASLHMSLRALAEEAYDEPSEAMRVALDLTHVWALVVGERDAPKVVGPADIVEALDAAADELRAVA